MDNTGNPVTQITPATFSDVSSLAYVRPIETTQGQAYAVCSPDGTQLAIFPSREVAYFAAKQHELEPVDIH